MWFAIFLASQNLVAQFYTLTAALLLGGKLPPDFYYYYKSFPTNTILKIYQSCVAWPLAELLANGLKSFIIIFLSFHSGVNGIGSKMSYQVPVNLEKLTGSSTSSQTIFPFLSWGISVGVKTYLTGDYRYVIRNISLNCHINCHKVLRPPFLIYFYDWTLLRYCCGLKY